MLEIIPILYSFIYIFSVLRSDEVACVDKDICYEVCQSYAGCTNIAYPRLVLGIMPEGCTHKLKRHYHTL